MCALGYSGVVHFKNAVAVLQLLGHVPHACQVGDGEDRRMKSVAMTTKHGIKQQTFSHVTWEPVGNRDVREVELCSERHPDLSVLCTLRVQTQSRSQTSQYENENWYGRGS